MLASFFLHIKAHRARKNFARMVAFWDQRIEQARKNHEPVRHLLQAKSEYVHWVLRGGR